MSELEQSLDAIIASDRAKKASHTVSRKRRAPSGRVGKSNRTRSNAAAKKAAAAAIAAAALKKANKSKGRNSGRVVSPTVDASSLEMATKVVVSGLPTDIKPLNVKEFFQSQIGGVSHVSLSYNERGQSTGVATVIFKHASTARKAVAKYNNAPIDGKRKTLKLELVVDPEQKSLAARITPNVVVDSSAVRARLQFKRNRRNQQVVRSNNRGRRSNSGNNNGNKNGNGNGNNNGNNNKGRKGGRSRRQKKTVAELDQEMADYFAEGKQLDRL